MKKRIFTLIVCIILLLSCLMPMQALAADEDDLQINLVTPMLVYITTATSSFDISGGVAYMGSSMTASGVDKLRLTNYLQKYINGSWSTVTSWSKTVSGNSVSLSSSYSVTSGTYRVRSYFYAYIDDVVVDSTLITPASDSY